MDFDFSDRSSSGEVEAEEGAEAEAVHLQSGRSGSSDVVSRAMGRHRFRSASNSKEMIMLYERVDSAESKSADLSLKLKQLEKKVRRRTMPSPSRIRPFLDSKEC